MEFIVIGAFVLFSVALVFLGARNRVSFFRRQPVNNITTDLKQDLE
ncbi:MAG: hypothetical protein LBS60_02885 [Deltaproteobacteria bacterium]|jgi:hypothetical protein|nr:hypothetical protein [Deltaproteobacteria bacterium]